MRAVVEEFVQRYLVPKSLQTADIWRLDPAGAESVPAQNQSPQSEPSQDQPAQNQSEQNQSLQSQPVQNQSLQSNSMNAEPSTIDQQSVSGNNGEGKTELQDTGIANQGEPEPQNFPFNSQFVQTEPTYFQSFGSEATDPSGWVIPDDYNYGLWDVDMAYAMEWEANLGLDTEEYVAFDLDLPDASQEQIGESIEMTDEEFAAFFL
jgi:hypothetical protein